MGFLQEAVGGESILVALNRCGPLTLTTTVHPAASAGPILRASIADAGRTDKCAAGATTRLSLRKFQGVNIELPVNLIY